MSQRYGPHDSTFATEDIPALVVETVLRGAWALVLVTLSVLRAAVRTPPVSYTHLTLPTKA